MFIKLTAIDFKENTISIDVNINNINYMFKSKKEHREVTTIRFDKYEVEVIENLEYIEDMIKETLRLTR